MFGRKPKLSVDALFDSSQDNSKSKEKSIISWFEAMRQAHQIAAENSVKSHNAAKRLYDKKIHHVSLNHGDRVLIRNLTPREGPHKLRSYSEDQVHIVSKRIGDSPVYVLKPDICDGCVRTLHRNMLLPCNMLEQPTSVLTTERTLQKRTRLRNNRQQSDSRGSSDGSNSDTDEVEIFLPVLPNDDSSRSRRSSLNVPVVAEEESCRTDISTPRSALSPTAPPFSPKLSNESSPDRNELVNQRPERVCNQPVMLNYDRFGSPSNIQYVNPLQIAFGHPIYPVPILPPWYFPAMRPELAC